MLRANVTGKSVPRVLSINHRMINFLYTVSASNRTRVLLTTQDLKISIFPEWSNWTVVEWLYMYRFFAPAVCRIIMWAPSSEFVSSSIPSWQILTAHALPFRGARDLAFCLKVPLDSLLVWASSEGSNETARMRRLAWTFAARIGVNYQIRLTRST